MYKLDPKLGRILVEIEALNENSHFSQEEMGILPLSFVMLILFNIFLGTTVWNYFKDTKQTKRWFQPLGILIIAILFELLHLSALSFHLLLYSMNGYGFLPLYVMSVIAQAASGVLVVWLLIMIAFGWMIVHEELEDVDIYLVIMCFVMMIHMIIAALTFVDFGEHYKYHDYGGL